MRIARYWDAVANAARYGIVEGEIIPELAGHPYGEIAKTDNVRPLAAVQLLAPCEPTKIVAGGANYHGHLKEIGLPIPTVPVFFLKSPTALLGPDRAVIYPPETHKLEYEGELIERHAIGIFVFWALQGEHRLCYVYRAVGRAKSISRPSARTLKVKRRFEGMREYIAAQAPGVRADDSAQGAGSRPIHPCPCVKPPAGPQRDLTLALRLDKLIKRHPHLAYLPCDELKRMGYSFGRIIWLRSYERSIPLHWHAALPNYR